MPVTASNLVLQYIFNEVAAQHTLVVNDQTDWLALGLDVFIDPLNPLVKIFLKCTVVTASGPVVFYDNTAGLNPDIVPGVSTTNLIPIVVPLDGDGNSLKGHYIFEGICKITDGVTPPYEFPFIYEYDYDFDSPCIKISTRVNCLDSNITSIDATDYGIYATTIVRVHTIFPNPPSGLPSLSSPLATLIYNGITSPATWSSSVSSTVTFTFPSGLIAIRLLYGEVEIPVVCAIDLKKFFCCLEKKIRNNDKNQFTNPSKFKENEILFARLRSLLLLYILAERFGCGTNVGSITDEIASISGCGDCGCGTAESPQLVIPANPNNILTYVVDSPIGTIQVTPDLQGNVMYFHIEKFNTNLPVVKVDTQTPNFITVIPSTNGNITTYFVNFTGLIPNPNSIALWVRIKKTAGVWGKFIVPMWCNGPGVNPFVDHISYLGGNWPVPPVDTDWAILHYENFVNAATDPPPLFTVHAQINNNLVRFDNATAKLYYPQPKTVEMEVFWTDTVFGNKFELRLWNPINGMPLQLGDLKDDYDCIFAVMINVQT